MKIILLMTILMLPTIVLGAPPGVSQPPVFNPFTGKLDYIGPGNGLKIGEIYYVYQDGSNNVYYTFDGSNFCLYMNSTQISCQAAPPTANDFLLLEDGTFMLLESGGKVLLEN